jgi:hypothetical protein
MQYFITDIEESILKRCVEFYTKLSEYNFPLFLFLTSIDFKNFFRVVSTDVLYQEKREEKQMQE